MLLVLNLLWRLPSDDGLPVEVVNEFGEKAFWRLSRMTKMYEALLQRFE